MELDLGGTVCRSTYKPLTGTKLTQAGTAMRHKPRGALARHTQHGTTPSNAWGHPRRTTPLLESLTPFLAPFMPTRTPGQVNAPLRPLPNIIFASRWLQLPLYLGLIAAQCVYVWHFLLELWHLVEAAFGNQEALQKLVTSIGYKPDMQITTLNETVIMLVVLALIDVVMISNLLIMVIIGGYETFVSRMGLHSHPDQPEWLGHVNASVLKVKLGLSIIGISSIHLLKTFINAANYDEKVLMWQTIIHVVFLLSAVSIAYTDKLLSASQQKH